MKKKVYTTTFENLPATLKKAREAVGLSQVAASKLLKGEDEIKGSPLIAKYEQGERNPSFPQLKKMCELYNIALRIEIE